jgi:hypothetical protein
MAKVKKPRDLVMPKTGYAIGTCYWIGSRKHFRFEYHISWRKIIPPDKALNWFNSAIKWTEQEKGS